MTRSRYDVDRNTVAANIFASVLSPIFSSTLGFPRLFIATVADADTDDDDDDIQHSRTLRLSA